MLIVHQDMINTIYVLFIRPDRHLYLDVSEDVDHNYMIKDITEYDMSLKVKMHILN